LASFCVADKTLYILSIALETTVDPAPWRIISKRVFIMAEIKKILLFFKAIFLMENY